MIISLKSPVAPPLQSTRVWTLQHHQSTVMQSMMSFYWKVINDSVYLCRYKPKKKKIYSILQQKLDALMATLENTGCMIIVTVAISYYLYFQVLIHQLYPCHPMSPHSHHQIKVPWQQAHSLTPPSSQNHKPHRAKQDMSATMMMKPMTQQRRAWLVRTPHQNKNLLASK